jgi:hypothetical protein
VKIVCWGGELHDQVVDVPADADGTPDRVLIWQVCPDQHLFVDDREDPIARHPMRRLTYYAVRMVDPTGDLARSRKDPPGWWVYVYPGFEELYVATARHFDGARRPFVDGPNEPLPVLLDRDRARRWSDPARDRLATR